MKWKHFVFLYNMRITTSQYFNSYTLTLTPYSMRCLSWSNCVPSWKDQIQLLLILSWYLQHNYNILKDIEPKVWWSCNSHAVHTKMFFYFYLKDNPSSPSNPSTWKYNLDVSYSKVEIKLAKLRPDSAVTLWVRNRQLDLSCVCLWVFNSRFVLFPWPQSRLLT